MSRDKLSKSLLQNSHSTLANKVKLPELTVFDLPEKVLQFGTGVLLRGLPDYFINKANNQGIFNGRIVVVKSTSHGDTDAFTEQDGLFTLATQGIENGKEVYEAEINASISRTLNANNDWEAVLEIARSADLTVIISNTTEVGLVLAENDGIEKTPPASFPVKLLAILYERYKHFNGADDKGLVIIPCELVPNNGQILHDLVMEQARRNFLNDNFIDWINSSCTFCNSLVDRIVPGKPAAQEHEKWQEQLGYTDDLLVACEPYRLWAIQGGSRVKEALSFWQADPGVIIETNIELYKERKLRLLNGTHSISIALGFLSGFTTVKQCMDDETLNQYVRKVALEEIAPSTPIPAEQAQKFGTEVLDRFNNPYIVHKLINITLQYTGKVKMRCIKLFETHAATHGSVPPLMTLGLAGIFAFLRPTGLEDGQFVGELDGKAYPINDAAAAVWHQAWSKHGKNYEDLVNDILTNKELWDQDLSLIPGLASGLAQHLPHLVNKPSNQVHSYIKQQL